MNFSQANVNIKLYERINYSHLPNLVETLDLVSHSDSDEL